MESDWRAMGGGELEEAVVTKRRAKTRRFMPKGIIRRGDGEEIKKQGAKITGNGWSAMGGVGSGGHETTTA
jgi:hypothetical protein